MRESVRLQKPAFYNELKLHNKQVLLLLSYQSNKISDFKEVDNAVTQLLQKLINAVC